MLVTLVGVTNPRYSENYNFHIIRHNINQVEICVSNYGKFGKHEYGWSGCWWPVGSNRTYIYGAGVWFGAIDSLTQDTLVSVGYNPYDGISEFVPGLNGTSPHSNSNQSIYIYPTTWPPPIDTFPMAPQRALSHQDSWCCFNDCDSNYHASGDTRPIGIEVYQTVYVWDISEVEDIVFFVYDIRNVAEQTLRDCYVGISIHCAIASWRPNDRCSAILNKIYHINGDTIVVDNIGYQWQEGEEPGTPSWFPGTIGFDLLQTPFDLVEGMDKDGDGILDQYERDSVYYVNNLPQYLWDADNDGVPDWRDPSQWPQLGMTAFKRYGIFPPQTDPERFLSMAGYDFVTGQYEPFDTIPPDPDDWWILVESSGPFCLLPDSAVTLIFAVVLADWYGLYLEPDTAIALTNRLAQEYYDMNWHLYTGIVEDCEIRISNCEMDISPNPIVRSGTVSFSLPVANHVSLRIYNIAGQLVHSVLDEHRSAGKHSLVLDCAGLAQGNYFLVLEMPFYKEVQSFVSLR